MNNNQALRPMHLLVGLVFALTSVASSAQNPIYKTQQFSAVYFHYPMQFFRNGAKSGIEVNMKDKYVLGIQYQNTFSFFPQFYNEPGSNGGGTGGINVNIIENYKSESNVKLLFKNYVGKYAYSFHGPYLAVFAEMGVGRESYYTQLAPNFPKNLITNNYKHRRVGVLFGKHWTLFNQGVLDVNFGVGFNALKGTSEMKYTAVPPFGILPNSPYFVSGIGLGIGKISKDMSLPRKPRLQDSLELDYALTLDLNAILHSGIEGNLYFGNRKKHLWRTYARYRSSRNMVIKFTAADSFVSYMAGFQYRYYPTTSRYRNGMYMGLGYSIEHATNYFNEVQERDGVFTTQQNKREYTPNNFDFTLGFTTIIGHRYILDAYLSNILTLSKGVNSAPYGRINEATGIRTELGVKFGIARFRKKWN